MVFPGYTYSIKVYIYFLFLTIIYHRSDNLKLKWTILNYPSIYTILENEFNIIFINVYKNYNYYYLFITLTSDLFIIWDYINDSANNPKYQKKSHKTVVSTTDAF